jgi:hypothetical protein
MSKHLPADEAYDLFPNQHLEKGTVIPPCSTIGSMSILHWRGVLCIVESLRFASLAATAR